MPGIAPEFTRCRVTALKGHIMVFNLFFATLFGERDGKDTHIIIKAKFNE